MPLRIAIVGGGVAGLTVGHLLHEQHEVTLFERARRIGGNAFSYTTRDGHDLDIAVAAFGKAGYREFFRLLDRLGIATQRSPGAFMSMQSLDTGQGLYLTPLSLAGMLAQRFALLRPGRVAELGALFLGLARLDRLLRAGRLRGLSLVQALPLCPEIRGEGRLLLLCALCLMSSMSGAEVLAAPAEFFARKLSIHSDVVSPRALYSVVCTANRTRSYVAALARGYEQRIVLGAELRSVLRDPDGVTLVDASGEARRFDKVVFACHADEALKLLAVSSEPERRLLGPWRYKDGRVVVHRDTASFPPRVLTQAYTFLYRERGGDFETSVSGALWRLPGVSPRCPYLSSQHPNFPIDDRLIELDTVLRTPLFDFAAYATVPELPKLNGQQHSYFCGSHFGHGLHEDAVCSAIEVARQLGVAW
jgi:predicted NAD/FAD-binding protein